MSNENMAYSEEDACNILNAAGKFGFKKETMRSYYTVDQVLRKILEFHPDSYKEMIQEVLNEIDEQVQRIKK